MANQIWTYETLAKADNRTLEHLVRKSPRPDLDRLNGRIYAGWLHGFRGKLSALFVGGKFKKGFALRNGRVFGYNENVVDDKKGPLGEWVTDLKDDGTPTHRGFFRCGYIEDEPFQKLYRNYEHTTFFNYNDAEINRGFTNTMSRVIRDFAVLPNGEDDYSIMLVKAYFQIFRIKSFSFHFWHSYFLLGHPEDIVHPPQW